MNAKLTIFSVASLVFMAMRVAISKIQIDDLPQCVLSVITLLAVLFAIVPVVLVFIDVCSKLRCGESFKISARLKDKIKELEIQKIKLEVEIAGLEERKEKYPETKITKLEKKKKSLEQANEQLQKQVGTYMSISEKLTRIETLVTSR